MRIRLTIFLLLIGILLGVVSIQSCKKNDTSTTHTPTPLTFVTPDGFPATVYDFSSNPLTKEGFELGRKLFFDGRLSKDGNFPCSSCHQNFAAFSTYDHPLSHGYNNQFTTRNAPGIFNLAWYKEFQWDGGVNNLDLAPVPHITAPNEMAEDVNTIIEKLKADPQYPVMFKDAFGTNEINSDRLLKALSQFTVMLVSSNSKYDKVKRGETAFDVYEQAGYTVFQNKCASCHTEPLFTDFKYHNIGLPLDNNLKDYGRMKVTHFAEDSLKFRTPSLRNVVLTFPYMHDGRFASIDQVFDHYSSGITYSPTLEPSLLYGIQLSAAERVNLKAFLNTLTDSSFINNKQFSQP